MNSYIKLEDKQKAIETIKNRHLISFDNISIYYKKIIDNYVKLGDRQKAIEIYTTTFISLTFTIKINFLSYSHNVSSLYNLRNRFSYPNGRTSHIHFSKDTFYISS